MGVRTSPGGGTRVVVDFASGSLVPSVFIGDYPWFSNASPRPGEGAATPVLEHSNLGPRSATLSRAWTSARRRRAGAPSCTWLWTPDYKSFSGRLAGSLSAIWVARTFIFGICAHFGFVGGLSRVQLGAPRASVETRPSTQAVVHRCA